MADRFLEVEGVSLRFGGVTALNDVSFTVREKEMFAVIGPNGAGKTSLFNAFTGVYQAEGSILFDGAQLVGRKPPEIAKAGVARTFQNLGLFEGLDVMENLLLGRHLRSKGGVVSGMLWWGKARNEDRQARAACEQVLEFFDLSDQRHAQVSSLPYGTKKRVELARVVAMEPRLLLLDEPVAGMNRDEKAEIAHWLKVVHRELDLTSIVVEHDMPFVMGLVDRILVLDMGKVIALDSPDQIGADRQVIEAYLGTDAAGIMASPTADVSEGRR